MEALRSKKDVREVMRAFEKERSPQLEIAFLLQDWEDGYNVGGLFRVADALGAKELILTGKTPAPPHPMIGVTSMGAHRRIPFRHFDRHDDGAQAALDSGWSLVAVELADGAEVYTDFHYPRRLCLALGSEGGGLYPALLKRCEAAVYIPMMGKGRSLNVHVSGAIVAFQAFMSNCSDLGVE